MLAAGAMLLALVPTVLAGVASPPTVSFPVPSPVVIGGPEVSWKATLTNPADGVGIPNTQPDSATDGASASRGREPADTADRERWLLVLGGSLVTIVALRRRLGESPDSAP